MAETKPLIRLAPDHGTTESSGSMTKKTARQIDAEAAGWAARIDRGPFEPAEEGMFQVWLHQDARCAGAYARMRALALSTERARALGPDFEPAAFAPVPFMARRTVLRLGGGLAAAGLIAVTGTWA